MNYLYDKSYIIATQKKWEDKIMIERLFSAIESMVNEAIPIAVEKYITEHKEKILVDIETVINGKSIGSDRLVEEIQNMIANELSI